MSSFHPACRECVLNNECLLQDNGDVEDCQDVIDWVWEAEGKIEKRQGFMKGE